MACLKQRYNTCKFHPENAEVESDHEVTRSNENICQPADLTIALGAQYGLTTSFEPSQDMTAVLTNILGAIGSFQGTLGNF